MSIGKAPMCPEQRRAACSADRVRSLLLTRRRAVDLGRTSTATCPSWA